MTQLYHSWIYTQALLNHLTTEIYMHTYAVEALSTIALGFFFGLSKNEIMTFPGKCKELGIITDSDSLKKTNTIFCSFAI